jgi:acetyl-CoA carboxylase carboxyl transferase subunit alpha
MVTPLDFEKSIAELEAKLREFSHLSSDGKIDIAVEVTRLQTKISKLLQQTYDHLTPWQKVQVARHPERPHFTDYVKHLIEDYVPLAGDRLFAEDPAICGGLGRFRGQAVMVMGHEKGHDVDSRLYHNFGMPRPEGYRKVRRLVALAGQFHLPILSFVDTAGAHPGVEAEERGQAEAIARSTEAMLNATVPIIAIITGEGGSGGAIALAAANEILMLEHSVYSVISPEGCASILWRTADKKEEAAAAQKLTAQDLLALGIIDHIIPEPLGGAQRHPLETIQRVGNAIEKELLKYQDWTGETLKSHRYQKFLTMGQKGL